MVTWIAARFEVNFVVDLICVRCLKTFTKKFNTNIHLNYIEGKDPYSKSERAELQPADVDRVYYNGSHIDVRIGIREAIFFSLPIAPLCIENCRGLCPVCGKDVNTEKCGCKIEKGGLFTPQLLQTSQVRERKKRRRKRKV